MEVHAISLNGSMIYVNIGSSMDPLHQLSRIMTNTSLASLPSPSSITDSEAMPWVPIPPGFSFKLIRATSDDDVWVELLRLEPGTTIPRHRHTGEVHAYTLAGRREALDTGEIAGPGSYVYEPPGNVDSWCAIGTAPLLVFVTVRGAI